MQGLRPVETSVEDILKEAGNIIIAWKATDEVLNGEDFDVLRTAICELRICDIWQRSEAST